MVLLIENKLLFMFESFNYLDGFNVKTSMTKATSRALERCHVAFIIAYMQFTTICFVCTKGGLNLC